MIFIKCLCIVHAAKYLGRVELGKPDQPLDQDENVRDQSHLAVDALEASFRV